MNRAIFINLIRALFPKWNFFDQIAYHFELEFKVPGAHEWSAISFQQTRKRLSLFLNAEVNLALAHMNILEHFAEDIQALQTNSPLIPSRDIQQLTTFKMVRSLLRLKLQQFESQPDVVQFKLTAKNPNESVDLYISDWINLGGI